VPDITSQLLNFAWWLKKEGHAETTTINQSKNLAKRGTSLFSLECLGDYFSARMMQQTKNERY